MAGGSGRRPPPAADDKMSDEPTFVDLYALTKITPDAVVERFGSSINSSFFDASNILGGLKIKKLIDFTTLFGNQNAITITDTGKQLLDEANKKSADQFDHLDFSVLNQLTKGGKSPNELSASLNIAQRDLAMHLYKMQTQGYLSSEFRNGTLSLSLTEKGFMQAKSGMPLAPSTMQSTPAAPQPAPAQEQKPPEEPVLRKPFPKGAKIAIVVVVIAMILVLAWEFKVFSLLGLNL